MTERDKRLLRIASYNIRKCIGTDRRRDPHRVLGVIEGLSADIVVLQEADRRLGRRPSALPMHEISESTGLECVKVATSDIGLGWHGNAILARPGTKVEHIERLSLPGLEPRGAVVADLLLPAGPLRVVGVHLGLVRASRKAQLSALTLRLSEMDERPTVIAGDFNEWSLKAGLGRLTHHFSIHAPGRSFHAKRPVAHLDRIAINDFLKPVIGGVVDTPLTRIASDHLPIWMELEQSEASAASGS